jgi:hypothetical protein
MAKLTNYERLAFRDAKVSLAADSSQMEQLVDVIENPDSHYKKVANDVSKDLQEKYELGYEDLVAAIALCRQRQNETKGKS